MWVKGPSLRHREKIEKFFISNDSCTINPMCFSSMIFQDCGKHPKLRVLDGDSTFPEGYRWWIWVRSSITTLKKIVLPRDSQDSYFYDFLFLFLFLLSLMLPTFLDLLGFSCLKRVGKEIPCMRQTSPPSFVPNFGEVLCFPFHLSLVFLFFSHIGDNVRF